ncbi:hypothetical protein CH063_10220 [Colletotrichum higginsianum]|uniref:Uncharacterized protein n=1 Tax=Colletotrichum higginsianum (strain IMI 349063) TaxID=759273 RepID=H1VGK9_COLHI|nr:hypothetical protein CH063_10220 [Colletotrichum higginsianum]
MAWWGLREREKERERERSKCLLNRGRRQHRRRGILLGLLTGLIGAIALATSSESRALRGFFCLLRFCLCWRHMDGNLLTCFCDIQLNDRVRDARATARKKLASTCNTRSVVGHG